MLRITTPSLPARVALLTLILAAETSCASTSPAPAPAGDFEGVISLALGLAGPASIRVGELPGHWYIDVRA